MKYKDTCRSRKRSVNASTSARRIAWVANQQMPHISIAIPVFNGAAYLAEAIACLRSQSLGDFEAIVLDNCSTDATRDIVAQNIANDSRFRLIAQPHNKGAMPNYIDGLREASGEFFLWRAFDDLSDPRYLETLRDALVAQPDAALATGRIRMINMDGSNERLIGFPKLSGAPLADTLRLLRGSHAGWFYGMWRRTALEEPFLEAMRLSNLAWGNDHLALLPFLLQRRVIFAPNALFHQRLKKVAGAPKTPARISFMQMRRARRDFAGCYRALLAKYGPRDAWSRTVLWAEMFPYREKRCYRLEQMARALARGRH